MQYYFEMCSPFPEHLCNHKTTPAAESHIKIQYDVRYCIVRCYNTRCVIFHLQYYCTVNKHFVVGSWFSCVCFYCRRNCFHHVQQSELWLVHHLHLFRGECLWWWNNGQTRAICGNIIFITRCYYEVYS